MNNDDPPLLAAIRALVGDPQAHVQTATRRALGAGFADALAGGEGLILHNGVCQTVTGEQPFQLVEKICRVLPNGRDPQSWLYWKREALAYASGYLDQPFQGIRPPACYGVAYTDEPAARIFIEAATDAQPDWTPALHEQAAHALGAFTASTAGAPDVQRHRWMAKGRTHSWSTLAAPVFDTLDERSDDPVLSRWLAGDLRRRTADLWRNMAPLKEALADLPRCFCHHDAFQRNLLVQQHASDAPTFVAIDWAFAGPGVIGEELAATFGAPLMFRDIAADDAPHMTGLLFDNYAQGLADHGWTGSPSDARIGFCATTAIMFGLGAFGTWLDLLRNPEFAPVVTGITGLEPDDFIDNLRDIQPHFLELGEEALSLIGV